MLCNIQQYWSQEKLKAGMADKMKYAAISKHLILFEGMHWKWEASKQQFIGPGMRNENNGA